MWATADADELVRTWAEELRHYGPDDLRGAFESLRDGYPDWPPTLYQFADLCRNARRRRAGESLKLDGPKTDMPAAIRDRLRAFTDRHKLQ